MANNSIKRDQNRQKELAYMRMIKQTMKPKSTEERQREIAAEEAAKKVTVESKISNFFYYYRKLIIVIVIVAIVGGILLASLLGRPSYDLRVLAAYSGGSLDDAKYSTVISEYAEDLNGNGEALVGVLKVCIDKNQDASSLMAERAAFTANLQLEDVCLYLVDEGVYNELIAVNENAFLDLSELYPDHPNVEGNRFFIKGSSLEKELSGAGIPMNLAIVVRDWERYGITSPTYEENIRLLDAIVNNTK